MFIAFIAVLLLLSVPVCGGRLSAVARLRFQGKWIVVAALLIQVAITGPFAGWPHALVVALHLLSYVIIGIAVWRNRGMVGLPIIAAGALLNGVTIALNGGTLPASARALAQAGLADKAGFNNSGVLRHAVLPQLGDIVATPAWLPFRNVISIGDMVALVGFAVLLHVACDSRLRRAWRRRRPEVATQPAEMQAGA
jgi:hypothetical protein